MFLFVFMLLKFSLMIVFGGGAALFLSALAVHLSVAIYRFLWQIDVGFSNLLFPAFFR
jgi:hypothetical protein